MPKTKLESVVFTALMVFCMVFSMTCYTGALRAGGVTYGLFILVVQGADGLHGRPGGDAVRIPAPRTEHPFPYTKKPRHADVAFVFHDARLMTGMPFCRAMRTVCAVPLLPSGSPQKQTQQSASSTRRLFRRRIQSLV